ncbi:MAG: hypothetical protein WBM02_00245 [bacterium]
MSPKNNSPSPAMEKGPGDEVNPDDTNNPLNYLPLLRPTPL